MQFLVLEQIPLANKHVGGNEVNEVIEGTDHQDHID